MVARAKSAGVERTVVSPLLALMPADGQDVVGANEETARIVRTTSGLLQWVVVDPSISASFDQAREMLSHPNCVGIKIHPEEHRYKIAEHGQTLFEFAAELDAVILSHSGDANSLPDDFLPLADTFADVRLILAHLGNGEDSSSFDLQVKAIRACKHGNIFTDTSSSRSLYPGLIEWAVDQVGAERILFGTDSPLYFAASQRARIDHADLDETQKRLILRENAERVLRLQT